MMVGKYRCGPEVTLTFTNKGLKFFPADGYAIGDAGFTLVNIPAETITRIQVDKVKGAIGIWANVDIAGANSNQFWPMAGLNDPVSSIYIEYDADAFDKPGRAASWPFEIKDVCPKLVPTLAFVAAGKISGRENVRRASQSVPPGFVLPSSSGAQQQQPAQGAGPSRQVPTFAKLGAIVGNMSTSRAGGPSGTAAAATAQRLQPAQGGKRRMDESEPNVPAEPVAKPSAKKAKAAEPPEGAVVLDLCDSDTD